MFTPEMLASVKKVEATRQERLGMEPRRMTAEEKDALLKAYHPDYREDGFDTIKIGPNKGEKVPKELGHLLHSNSRLLHHPIDLTKIDYDTDVLVVGGGGAGRLHYQNFPTSNHYGATADGLVLGYRAGAPLLYQDTIQYHPTGVAFPAQIYGALVTEKVRSLGAMLVNVDGEAFMHPLETRDVAAASIIRECTDRHKGVTTPLGSGVWLDTPMIEQIGGEGTIEKRIPAMLRMYLNYDIDMRKSPILVYPTLHYQNGGLEIGGDGFTKAISNLLVAGEAVGGIHGRNRLMGNSLLDIIVFGRNAGKAAAAKAKETELGTLTLKHIEDYAEELKSAGIESEDVSPLLLPHYARHER